MTRQPRDYIFGGRRSLLRRRSENGRGRPPIPIFRIYFHITPANERTAAVPQPPLNSGTNSICQGVTWSMFRGDKDLIRRNPNPEPALHDIYERSDSFHLNHFIIDVNCVNLAEDQ